MFDEPGFPRDAEPEGDELALSNFVYCSRAAETVDDAEVGRIVELAQRRNSERGITGVLTFGSGVFFQWIEGPPEEMQKLIASLHKDPRHFDVVTLGQTEEKRERLYPDWEMERVGAEDIRDVLEDALDCAEDENNITMLKRILAQLDVAPLKSLGQS